MGQEYTNMYKFKILDDKGTGTFEIVRIVAPDARKAQATLATAIEGVVVLEVTDRSLIATASIDDDVLRWTPDDGVTYNTPKQNRI